MAMPALCYFYMHFAIFIFYLSDACIEGEVIPTNYFLSKIWKKYKFLDNNNIEMAQYWTLSSTQSEVSTELG